MTVEMSNAAVSRLDSKVLGDYSADAVPSREEAELALIGADIPSGDVTRVLSRATYGRFVAPLAAAGAVACSEFHQGQLELASLAMSKIITDPKSKPRDIILAAAAVPQIASTSAVLSSVQLKAAESLAMGKKTVNRRANAPMSITGTVIQADNVQINASANQPTKSPGA